MTIDIKAESFPWQAKLVGALFVLVALAVISNYWWLSVLLLLLGLIALFGHSGTIINPDKREIHEYTSYLFFKQRETISYTAIERIFINAERVSQQMHPAHTLDSFEYKSTVYNAYLKLDSGKKIFLTSRKNKEALRDLLDPIASKLKTEVVDYTVSDSQD